MDIQEVGWGDIDSTDVAQDSERWQVTGPCERGNEPSGSIKCGEFLE
jgi:hypothetical protein